jgi:hypothetical protein
MKTAGIVFLILGVTMTIFTGFNVVTKKEVVDIGSLEINKTEETPIYWSPITGGILAVVGVVLLVTSKKKRSVMNIG